MASQVHIGTATPGRDGARIALDLQPLSGPGGTPNPDAALVGDSLPANWQRVALSCKDRGAGFATGHRADAMLWWSASKRQFVSPSGQIPPWAGDLVTPLATDQPLSWAALDPRFLARHTGPDVANGEAAAAGTTAGVVVPAYGQTLPKDVQRNRGPAGRDPRGYSFRTSPFCDTSVLRLASQALQHDRPNKNSPPLFENLLAVELQKQAWHQGDRPDWWFYRDAKGLEVDFPRVRGLAHLAVEAKSGATLQPEWTDNLRKFQTRMASRDLSVQLGVVYGGDEARSLQGVSAQSWRRVGQL